MKSDFHPCFPRTARFYQDSPGLTRIRQDSPKGEMTMIKIFTIILAALLLTGCGATATAHIYQKPDGTVLWCPEELVPPPTTWEYAGTATVQESEILEQCELE